MKPRFWDMKLKIGFWLVCLGIALISFSGCEDSERDDDDETVASHDNALAETIFLDIFKQIHRVAARDTLLNDTGLVQDLDICLDSAVVSDTLPIFPLNLTLYYGNQASLCSDGRTRRGRVNATFSGRLKSTFTRIDYSINSYWVDDIRVWGNVTVENVGVAENGNRIYVMSVEDGRLEGEDIAIDWESTMSWQWVGGFATDMNQTDDEWLITAGSSSGRNTKGNTFVANVIQPQGFDMVCKWIKSGEVRLLVPNLATRTVNYGSGTCDNIISVTRNATTFNVTLE